MQIPTKEIRDGNRIGELVWICHYNRPDMHKKALRNVAPIQCLVKSIEDLPKHKTVYYSSTYFAPLNKKGGPSAKIISPVDNTGYRSLCGNELFVFDNEAECVAEWNKQLADHQAVLDTLIENAAQHWINERQKLVDMKGGEEEKTMIKPDDHVRILTEPEDGINGYGRVTAVDNGFALISNMNMPYQGTFANKPFGIDQLEKV